MAVAAGSLLEQKTRETHTHAYTQTAGRRGDTPPYSPSARRGFTPPMRCARITDLWRVMSAHFFVFMSFVHYGTIFHSDFVFPNCVSLVWMVKFYI